MVFNPGSDGYFVDVHDQLMWRILQLKQNCPHLELRGEALTGSPAVRPLYAEKLELC
jgi:hypothetical protein